MNPEGTAEVTASARTLRTLRWLADGIAALSVIALVATGVAIAIARPELLRSDPATLVREFFQTGILPFVLGYGAVGWLLARRLPSNPIGWLFSAGGLMWAAAAFDGAWVELALTGHVDLGLFARVSAVQTVFGWIFSMPLSVQLPLLLLPNGHLLSRRWRPAVWVVVTGVIVGTLGFVTIPGLIEGFDSDRHLVNPLGVRGLGLLPQTLAITGAVMMLVGMAAGVVAVVVRFRRSSGVERQQMRWVALGGCCVVLGPATALVAGIPDWWNSLIGTLSILALPLCVGVAVLRYRLYDLGRLVSRTVSYVVITTLLLGVYFGLVTASTRILPSDSSLAVAASTLAAAALFQPLRRRVQRVVDRRFNRSRYDADRTVEAFTRRLRDEVDLDSVRTDLLRAVHDTLQPATAGLWLRSPGGRSLW
jgi:hypothetical protein